MSYITGFRYEDKFLEWPSARTHCQNEGGDLASLFTNDQWEAAAQYVMAQKTLAGYEIEYNIY